MRRLIALVCALILAGTGLALAQEYVATPVTVSKEKVRLNGKVYLSHVVLDKQTLYGISRAYGVSIEEIQAANPSIEGLGIKKNSIILIPYHDQSAQEEEIQPQEPQAYTEHTVRWYEDIDDIARKYDVSVKDIMDYNGLTSRKLTTRQVLKIPIKGSGYTPSTPQPEQNQPETPKEEPVVEVPVTTEPLPETEVEAEAEAEQEPEPLIFMAHPKDLVEMALILPLQGSGNTGEMNMDFYSGVLMAIRDVEAEGTRINAHVYDITAGIPQADVLSRCDFVLGPVNPREVEAILQRVDGRVPVISPLDQKAISLSDNYANFVQAPPATEYQYADLCHWVKEELQPQDRILLITEKSASNVTAAVSIRSALANEELPYDILSYAIMDGRGIPATLSEKMTQNGVNRLIVASESEAFIGDVVRNIGIVRGKGYDVVMYAPSKVKNFDTIEGSSYHDAYLHICTPYFADYSGDKVTRFIRSYRALFRTEPSQFAFQGYDTAWYFLTACARFGEHWQQFTEQWRGRGLHTDFLLEKDRNGNLRNTAVRRIVFQKDYSTTLEP